MTKDSTSQMTDCSPEEKAYIRRRRVVSILSLCVLLAFIAVVAIVVGKPLVEMLRQPPYLGAAGLCRHDVLTGCFCHYSRRTHGNWRRLCLWLY